MDIKLHKYNCCDFNEVDSIGVICRGESLGSIGKYKEYFKNMFVVGQHYESFKIIGDHILESNIVKVWGSTFNKPSKGYKKQYDRYNIKDMQTYLNPSVSDRKAYKFKKICKRHDGIMDVYPMPDNFFHRNQRLFKEGKRRRSHPTLGLFAVDLACAYKPKYVNIIGLDFYQSGYLAKEKKHMSIEGNKKRAGGMMSYLKTLCMEESDIQFRLYTCCKNIKSSGNLSVIDV